MKLAKNPSVTKLLAPLLVNISEPQVTMKASKRRVFDAFKPERSTKTSKPRLPESLDDFINLANCVPPSMRRAFLTGPPPDEAYGWLAGSPVGSFLPPKAAVARRVYTLDQLAREEPEPPDIQFAHWLNAVRFSISVFERLTELQDVFDFSSQEAVRSIPWSPPWNGRQLEIAPDGTLHFRRLDHLMSAFYENFEKALTRVNVTRLRRCCAKLRDGIVCNSFFYAKRIGKFQDERARSSRACSPKHAALMRQKKHLVKPTRTRTARKEGK